LDTTGVHNTAVGYEALDTLTIKKDDLVVFTSNSQIPLGKI